MDILILFLLFIILITGGVIAFRLGGLNWVYVYVAAMTGSLFVMDFMQVIVFGQLLFVAEVFFAASFLITDMIEEHYGKKAARMIIPVVIGSWVFIWGLTNLGVLLNPAESDPFHGPLSDIVSFYTPMAMGLIVVIYSTLQFIDTAMYDWIRNKSNGKFLWLRNLGSTITTQSFDVLASYGVLIYILFPELTWAEIGSAMLVAAIFKGTMAVIDTPFIYLSYKFKPKTLISKRG